MRVADHQIFHSAPFRVLLSQARQERKQVFLVGGFLRDLALGREKSALDLDFSLAADAVGFSRRLARRLKAGFVVLDREHGCGRVVYKDKGRGRVLTFDFVDFRGRDLKEDLAKRDFTINTLAAPLPPEGAQVLDYYGASRDLGKRLVRAVRTTSFDEDPLRVLRAFSLSAIFGFRIAAATQTLIAKKKQGLKKIAGERLRDELFKILDVGPSWRYLDLLDKRGILELVIPQVAVMHNVAQGAYHHLDVWGHSLETVKKLEELMERLRGHADISAYLEEELTPNRRRRQLIKLAALLHDIGKPEAFEVKAGKTMFHGHERIGRVICDAVSEKLRLSTREKFAMDTIIFWHLRPGYLADNAVLTKRAVHRYFRDTKEEALSVLLVSIADQRATRGPMANRASRRRHEKVAFSLMDEYFALRRQKPFQRLINGDDLIRSLRLAPGPIFSRLLDSVEEAQVDGKIRTKREALAFVRRLVNSVP